MAFIASMQIFGYKRNYSILPFITSHSVSCITLIARDRLHSLKCLQDILFLKWDFIIGFCYTFIITLAIWRGWAP